MPRRGRAVMDAAWRHRALREFGVEPLLPRRQRAPDHGAECVVLAPVAARDGAAAQALVEAITAALAALAVPAQLRWLAPGSGAASAGARVLALGVGGSALPEPAALLADPARKREVWQAVAALAAAG